MIAQVATPPRGKYRTRPPHSSRPGSHESSSSFFDQSFGQWGDENPNLIEQTRKSRSRDSGSSRNRTPVATGHSISKRRYLSDNDYLGGPFVEQLESFNRDLLGNNTLYFEPLKPAKIERQKPIKQVEMQMTLTGQNLWPTKKGKGTLQKSPTQSDGLPFPRLRKLSSRSRPKAKKPWIVPDTKKDEGIASSLKLHINSIDESLPRQSIVDFSFEEKSKYSKNNYYKEKLAIGPTWGCDASYKPTKNYGSRRKATMNKSTGHQINVYSPGGSISLKSTSSYIDENGRLIGSPFTSAHKLAESNTRESPYVEYSVKNHGQIIDPIVEARSIKKIREMIVQKQNSVPSMVVQSKDSANIKEISEISSM